MVDQELTRLYDEDQADRAKPGGQIDWAVVTPRDEARRRRVAELVSTAGPLAADDYDHAAMVYQHGSQPDEIQRAHDLAIKAVALDPAHDSARWLAAAAEDRKLMYEYKPQKWGTQFEWNVPPLAASVAQAASLNATK